jgi:acetyltransferase
MTIRNLDFLFRPRSIAVIGASDRERTVGAAVMRNLLRGGFRGPILPVHSKRRSVAGVHAYREVAFLPQAADLALICTPPDTVEGLVRSLGVHGTRAAVILTDGVAPDPVLAVAQPHLMRILGPNSMGLLVPGLGINASFAPTPAAAGPLAFVSQSGALLAAALNWAAPRKLGFTHVVSLGDASDVDAADVLDFLGGDPATRAILLYIESVRDGRKFLSAARAAARNKPLIVMKSGRTAAGAEAAMRHTGAHPGDDDAFDAAIARAGMLRVNTIAALFEAAETLGRMRASLRSKLFVLTNAGGPGVIAADAIAEGGGELARAPVDLGADAAPERHAEALGSALAESAENTVLLIHGPSGVVADEAIAEGCKAQARDTGRVLACWMGGEGARRGASLLREAGVPVYETPEAAVQAYFDVLRYRRSQQALQETPDSMAADYAPDEGAVRSLLAKILAEGREHLTDPEGKALLVAYGVPIVHTHVAASADAAAKLAAEIGYPVALKVLSPDLEHRSEVGGVVLNIENEEELRGAARDIARRVEARKPPARLAGFTVQRMIRPPGAVHRRHGARELVLHAAADRIFGMVMRLDQAVGIVPLNAALAIDMLERGATGAPAVAAIVVRLSQLLARHPEIAELEIDPLLADEQGVMALEVRARIASTKLKPGEHLAIRPYPCELEEAVELRGLHVLLRPIRPEDARAYAEFIARTDAPDLQYRFFSRVRRVTEQDLARYTQIDYDREMAFVAEAAVDSGAREILGEARIMVYPDGESAEFALLVRSDVQRRGLGDALMRKLIDYCRARRKTALIGQMRPENRAMIALSRRRGMDIEVAPEGNLAVAHLDLQPPPPEVRLF